MMVGRSTPRYQSMSILYPRSKELQDHLFEYFIVVVDLCHRILKFSQKSKIGQMTSSFSDMDLKNYQSQLELWANMIKEDVNSLTAKSFEDERRQNSHHRALSSMFSNAESLRQKMKTKLRVLDSCSTYDYQTTWKQTRKLGNATLFQGNAEYQAWKHSATSCTLVYTGKLGSGKSVLMANIVDDLHLRNNHILVTYFFCRYDLPESLKAQTVFGSLARQLLVTISDLSNDTRSLYDRSETLDIDEVLDLLHRNIPPDMIAYFIVDGLDECSTQEKENVIRQLRILQDKFKLLICISLRLEPETTLELKSEDYYAMKTITIPETNPDLEVFIKGELTSCVETKKLILGDPELIIDIQNTLLRGSQGMFLWTALQIKALCAMKTDDDIRQAIADLPKDLSETYSRILRRVKDLGMNYQKSILELILVAYRPLTMEELRDALSVTPGDTTWDSSKLINSIRSTLTCCGALIDIDEEDSTVRLLHHSVMQYLLGGPTYWIRLDCANRTMVDIIATYLNYNVLDTQLSIAVPPKVIHGTAPSRIIHSTINSGVPSFALKLLKPAKLPDFDMSRTLADTRRFKTRPVDEFHFYDYAKSYGMQHILDLSNQEPLADKLLLRLLKRNVINVNATTVPGSTPLSIAVMYGNEALVKLLLDSGKFDVNLKNNNGSTALMQAAYNRQEAIVKLLLDSGKVEVNSKDHDGFTALAVAAYIGHEAIVKLLLDSDKVDVNAKYHSDTTALSWAAKNGREAIVKLLLDSGKVDVNSKYNGGTMALSWAAQNGHEAIVKLLLDSGKVDVNSNDDIEIMALPWAAQNGHEAIVKLLLDSGKFDVNSRDDSRSEALAWAAQDGYEAIVKLLLDSGCKADSKSVLGVTPLSLAQRNGHKAIVKLLQSSKAL